VLALSEACSNAVEHARKIKHLRWVPDAPAVWHDRRHEPWAALSIHA
jgi:hypothetical protein